MGSYDQYAWRWSIVLWYRCQYGRKAAWCVLEEMDLKEPDKPKPRHWSRPYNITTRDDRYLIPMTVMEYTTSSRAVALRWCMATSASLSAQTVRRRLLLYVLQTRVPRSEVTLKLNHRRPRLQWAHRHSHVDWQQVVFSDESCYNLDYKMDVYSSDLHRWTPSPGCLIQCDIRRIPSVMIWGAIGYHTRSHLLQIPGTLNS